MKLFKILLLLLISTYVFASSTNSLPNEFMGKNLRGWSYVRPALNEEKTSIITIAIKQKNLDVLENIFWSVSNPNNELYGQYLSLEQLGEIVGNKAGALLVIGHLVQNGVKDYHITKNGDFIRAGMTAKIAEKVFGSKLHKFVDPNNKNHTILRGSNINLPYAVNREIDFVSGFHTFISPSRPSPIRSYGDNIVSTSGNATPQLLRKYYNITMNNVATTKSTVCLFETLGQSYSPEDLTQFQNTFNLPVQGVTKVIGPNNPKCRTDPNDCGEANLDVQYMMALAGNAPTTFWSISQDSSQPYVDFLVAVANDPTPPLVHSMSYGDVEELDDPTMQQRFNTEVQKLSTRGITVVVSSGDDGVANFLARSNSSECGFNPAFPASSPYVTAVGATQGPEVNSEEVACASNTGGLITTGGGFSARFNQPSYQSNAVKSYLNSGVTLPPSNMYNSEGRAYPDVSLLGHNYEVIIGGSNIPVSGTSASAPAFGAMIALINSERLSSGKSSLGFLNQVLYNLATTNPSVYHDITKGENNCCAGRGSAIVCCKYGFYAYQGWDPTTGLGTINFSAMKDALVSLP